MSEKIRVIGDTIEFMGQPVATIKSGLAATLRAAFVDDLENQPDYWQGHRDGKKDGYEEGYRQGLADGDD